MAERQRCDSIKSGRRAGLAAHYYSVSLPLEPNF
jgi:hypothetical protein